MTRPGIRCPACGEEMPRGMASCRYCRAPPGSSGDHERFCGPGNTSNSRTGVERITATVIAECSAKTRASRATSGSEGKAGQTETSGVASEGVITVAAINHCGSGERNAADEGQKAVRRCMACQSLIVRRCVVAAGSNGHARQQSFMEL